MRCELLLLTAILVLGLCIAIEYHPYSQAISQGDSRTPKATVAEFKKNLGRLKVGEEPAYTFSVANTSDTAMRITAVHKSCSCQSADVCEGALVAVGEKLPITFALSSRRSGKQSGTLVLSTDSREESLKNIVLTLEAELPRIVWATPRTLRFDDSSRSPQQFTIESNLAGLLDSFDHVVTSRGLVEVKIIKRQESCLTFEATCMDNSPANEAFDFIEIAFNDPRHRYHLVSVHSSKATASASDESPRQ
jgi:hypothetical protein